MVEALRGYQPDGAVLITTPQGVALTDVRREANFCVKASQSQIRNQNGMQATSGFEMCFAIGSQGAFGAGGPTPARVSIHPKAATYHESNVITLFIL